MRKLWYQLQLRYYYNKLKSYDTQQQDYYSEKYMFTESKLRGLKK